MNKKEVVKLAIEAEQVEYVPWHCTFTLEAAHKLKAHFDCDDLDSVLNNHFYRLGDTSPDYFTALGDNRFKDPFGVVWNRTVDKDIGIVENCQLPEPTLTDFTCPHPSSDKFFAKIATRISEHNDCFLIFGISFSLYERAWTLRGMENLMTDFIVNPNFVRQLLRTLADFNIALVEQALKYDIDAVHFGDDWGQQMGLQMGPQIWREFILPELTRMYKVVRDAGKYVTIHSCGKVDEVFDDLVDAGLNCFNPFQPEVMDVFALMEKYRGRLAFYGGLSTQKTLPYGSVQDVRQATSRLLQAGSNGGYIFAPAHAVEGDVPLENMLAFIDVLHSQGGYTQ